MNEVRGHPTNGIDDLVHQRHRLGILTITAEAQLADFGYLRDALGLTPGNLSRHLTVLEDAGLVLVVKGYEGRRARTQVRITREGRAALSAERTALTELVSRHGPAGTGTGPAGPVPAGSGPAGTGEDMPQDAGRPAEG
jgi:DNA-binding transcriptional ArsR family regulator